VRIITKNLFDKLAIDSPEEVVTILAESKSTRIETILSHGQASPEGFWYDQLEHEWVVVLKGSARLRFEVDNQHVDLGPGECVLIPAGCRHRVEWTNPAEPTLWLAIFYSDS
jgi:cupin 2 domain-containing protein